MRAFRAGGLVQIAPGIVVGDKYQIESALARGGMGSVWVARHVKLGSTVAIKFLDADLAVTSGAVARFEREARAAATLDTPHVVRVHDYGVEHGCPYLVMELLRGEDLNTRLRKRRRLSLAEAAKIVSQMGRALRRAHEAGIVHRDLKPANVFLARIDDDEVVKILDFGIAKETWSRVEDATKTGEVFGSPHYMSPEQTRAQKTIDPRADIWATGVILYRMITGRLPFPGDVLGEILSSVLVDPVPPMAEAAPDLPAGLDTFFAKALAKKKEERYSTIDELVDAFAAVAERDARASSPDDSAQVGHLAPAARDAGGAQRPSIPGAPPAFGPAGAAPALSMHPELSSTPADSRPSVPRSAAHGDTLLTVGGPGTVDTGAATLPYRPATPARGPLPSAAEARTSAGATGPSIAGATASLLPPELAPRRRRVVVVVVGFALTAILVVVVVLLGVSAPGPEPGAATTAAEGSATAPAPATDGIPSVRVEPGRPADLPSAPVPGSASSTATEPEPPATTKEVSAPVSGAVAAPPPPQGNSKNTPIPPTTRVSPAAGSTGKKPVPKASKPDDEFGL